MTIQKLDKLFQMVAKDAGARTEEVKLVSFSETGALFDVKNYRLLYRLNENGKYFLDIVRNVNEAN